MSVLEGLGVGTGVAESCFGIAYLGSNSDVTSAGSELLADARYADLQNRTFGHCGHPRMAGLYLFPRFVDRCALDLLFRTA